MDSLTKVRKLLLEVTAELGQLEKTGIASSAFIAEREKIGAMANELNNLLQEILGYAALMRSKKSSPEQVDLYLSSIIESINGAANISAKLAAVSREGMRVLSPDAPAITPPPPVTTRISSPATVTPSIPSSHETTRSADTSLRQIPPIDNPTGSKPLVMVVDDEENICTLTQMVLVESGYKVVMATSGSEAISAYRHYRQQISLILLDYSMPGMDGAETFMALKNINANVKVLLTSGYHESDKIKNLLAQGLLGFLPKPYSEQKLLLYLKQVLGV